MRFWLKNAYFFKKLRLFDIFLTFLQLFAPNCRIIVLNGIIYTIIPVRRNMAFIKVNAFFAIFLLAASSGLNAQIPNDVNNGSFELADDANSPIGWDKIGWVQEIKRLTIFTAYDKDENPITIHPVDGNSFVILKSGGGDSFNYYGQLSQIISVNAGQSIRGVYFFATDDWVPPFNDTGVVKLIPADPCSGLPDPCFPEIILAYKDVNSVTYYNQRNGGSMADWGRFSHTFDSNGTYILTLRVEDFVGDYAYSSYLAVDALIIDQPPVPICIYNLIGDINHDCKVDFVDFAMMAANWLVDCNVIPNDPAVCLPP